MAQIKEMSAIMDQLDEKMSKPQWWAVPTLPLVCGALDKIHL
jgi:hypothetical protein